MSENKQPRYGDAAPNYPGDDGYGFEEHEQFVSHNDHKPSGVHIEASDSVQPLRGDAAMNQRGNNGYGYEEHEQYVTGAHDEPSTHAEVTPDRISPEGLEVAEEPQNIQILAGDDLPDVRVLADKWHMKELGVSIYDSGEYMTDSEVAQNTAVYYENLIPNKTNAFMNAVKLEFPDADVQLSSMMPNEGMSMDELERFDIDLSGLDDENTLGL